MSDNNSQPQIQSGLRYALKNDSVAIPKLTPYTNDKMNRRDFGDTLKNLVDSVEKSLVISVNGPWGMGKTTFLKMWDQSLANDGFTTIYFSAWEDDYCEDALTALVGQIYARIKDSEWHEIGQVLKEVAKPFVGKTAFNALRILTGGVVDLNDQNLKSCLENALDEYIESGNILKSTKKKLEEKSQECLSKSKKPLIVIIDELDRCRPTFAISLLEKIKHFFDIPGIIFVLGIDRTQLGHSIKSIYGQDMDVNGYLRRFLDLEFLLPPTSHYNFITESAGTSGGCICVK